MITLNLTGVFPMNSKSISSQDIEMLARKESGNETKYAKLIFRLDTIWSHLKHYLLQSCEPHLWQEYSSTGLLWWCAYDPKTQQSVYGLTETEMRRWLDQLPH
jgi:hypothetical protein